MTDGHQVLDVQVFAGTAYKAFGEFTPDDARQRAAELKQSVGWGPMSRVAPIARGWQELAEALGSAGATTVSDLDDAVVAEFARRLWIGGSLL